MCPLWALVSRPAPDGFNIRTPSSLDIVSIHAHWEHRTRGEIARALGLDLNAVRSPPFSDMRRMRNSLLHACGWAESSKHFDVLQWFNKGDVVVLNPYRFRESMDRPRGFPDAVHTPGFDPLPGLKR